MTENGLMDGTRTEKLFYNDSHLSKFTAMVLECEPYEKKEGCYAVELDRTAFFPEGGGQYADTGKLKDAKVSDVREKNGRILHITDQPFEAGEIVEGEIDWKTRFMKMQQHTGEHIVSGIVHARYGFNNVGFHLGTEDCTMDFDGEISKEALQEIELEANRAVWKNLTIEVSYPSKEELEELLRELRMKTPDEIKRYQKIITNRDAILADAKAKADAMIEEAQVQTTELVSEHEIMQQAYAQANEIVTQATAQAQEILDNATMDANTIRVGAIQYTDDLLANAESIIGHTLDSYTTKYDGLINSLQECYDTVRSNRSELEVPSDDGYYDENGQGDLR